MCIIIFLFNFNLKQKVKKKKSRNNNTREATRGCGHVRCLRGNGTYTTGPGP